ncbi:hypothetical protein [Acidocella aromatica]|uniref:AsmA domain-containing protein n=1 Tax=Acidocella aromatica TaxID=1303579 RepID=A0A840VQ12_9PROT|nr:hypothetical protein [Acidocella aromatica]MBB5373691.1 hypothetical protein [Acidocella aromatica]
MWKKLGIALAVLLALIAGAAYFLFSNLDSLIKAAIEKYGSAATQTAVSVDRVHLSLTSGAGSISGISISNPAGYSSSQALTLGDAAVQVDTSSIAGNGPIVIDTVTIAQPHVTYEVKGLGDGSNLQTIQRNVQAYAGSSGQQQPAQQQQSGGANRKEIIKDLYVTGGQISVAAEALNGRSLTVPLPDIHLTNIGQASGGATAAEVANQVLGAITNEATKVASTALTQQLQAAAQGALQGAIKNGGSITNGVGSQLKGLLGN